LDKDLTAATAPTSLGVVSVHRPSVLVVEDETSIAVPFAAALERDGFHTRVARSIADARRSMEAETPAVIVLDVGLPDGDGRDFCRELRAASAIPIIMLTARGTEADRIVGLELGADDYVVKPFSAGEVSARIRAVLRRSAPSPAVQERGSPQRFGDVLLDARARRVWLGDTEVTLSRKEFDLLVRLAQDAGHVVRREALMSDVWDVNWFGSTKTLDVHVGFLRRKLGDDPQDPRLIQTVRGVGFRFGASDDPADP
jgi:two-component system, OmpR family, response regulator RegX3